MRPNNFILLLYVKESILLLYIDVNEEDDLLSVNKADKLLEGLVLPLRSSSSSMLTRTMKHSSVSQG